MRAAVLVEEGQIEVQDIAVPELAPDDVLIDVAATGICGSDLHAWHGRHPFRRPPVVLGHEVSGTISRLGSAVTDRAVGQRVVVEPQRICTECDHCRAGRHELCATKVLPGTHGWNGSLAEHFSAPSYMTHPIPDELDLVLAALAEPLAVAVHANRRGGITAGMTVNVIGAGSIGLLVTTVARSLGATVDIVTDLDPAKLEFAGRIGAQRPINVRERDIVAEVRTAPVDLADVTVVAATAPSSIVDAGLLTKPGGTIVLLGLYGDTAQVGAALLVTREQQIVASVLYDSSDFRTAIDMMSADAAHYEQFVTSRITLDDADREFTAQAAGVTGVKTLIIPSQTN